jgi:signal transduction histidine kinase
MFLKIVNKINKKINLRLSAIFSLLFIISSLVLFGITYFLISSSLVREDRAILRSKLLELWAHYQSGGILNIQREVTVDSLAGDNKLLLLRLADPKNETLFLLMPEGLQGLNRDTLIKTVQGKLLEKFGNVIRFKMKGKNFIVETGSVRLSDGNFLQIGMNIYERIRVLNRIRITFAFAMIPLVFISFSAGSYLAARSLRPISHLGATVQSIINTGKINSRIPVHTRGSGGELEELVTMFNTMLEKIELLVRGIRGALDSVAHDLRTPMARLRGIAELALRYPAEPDQGEQSHRDPEIYREALADCMEESERILTMLNTLMDISEAESGIMKLNRRSFNISELIEQCVEIYRYVAEDKGIALHTAVPKDIHAFVDNARVRQVVLNLLDNAIKYTPKNGKVEIGSSSNDNNVVISVRDSGIGIESDELLNIWDRLYRGKNTNAQPGLGLGLSFVKAVVGAHGGNVKVVSEPSKGSEFSISLPS